MLLICNTEVDPIGHALVRKAHCRLCRPTTIQFKAHRSVTNLLGYAPASIEQLHKCIGIISKRTQMHNCDGAMREPGLSPSCDEKFIVSKMLDTFASHSLALNIRAPLMLMGDMSSDKNDRSTGDAQDR